MSTVGAPQVGAREPGWFSEAWQGGHLPVVAIVATNWHRRITDGLVAGAQKALRHAGVSSWRTVRVPGAFELPLGVQGVLGRGESDAVAGESDAVAGETVDAAVALGVVIRGGTPHFDYVCRGATDGLTRVGLDAGKPVGFGVLTCDTEEEALDRAGLPGSSSDKGAEAAEAVLDMLLVLWGTGVS